MILRKAVFEDWKVLLEWRNDPDTRKNSREMGVINEIDHKVWLQKLLEDHDRQLFIAIEDEKAVGSVRADFDKLCGLYELSWSIAPNERGKGIGKKMVKLLTDRLNGKVRAEIKKGNTGSIKIAEHAGMKFHYESDGILHYTGVSLKEGSRLTLPHKRRGFR